MESINQPLSADQATSNLPRTSSPFRFLPYFLIGFFVFLAILGVGGYILLTQEHEKESETTQVQQDSTFSQERSPPTAASNIVVSKTKTAIPKIPLINTIVFVKPSTGDIWTINPNGTNARLWIKNPGTSVGVAYLGKFPQRKKIQYGSQRVVLNVTTGEAFENKRGEHFTYDYSDLTKDQVFAAKLWVIDAQTGMLSSFFLPENFSFPRWSLDETLMAFIVETVPERMDISKEWTKIVITTAAGEIVHEFKPKDFSQYAAVQTDANFKPEAIWLPENKLAISFSDNSAITTNYDGSDIKLFGKDIQNLTLLPEREKLVYERVDIEAVKKLQDNSELPLRASKGIFMSNLNGTEEKQLQFKRDVIGKNLVELIIALNSDMLAISFCSAFGCIEFGGLNASTVVAKLSTGEIFDNLPIQHGPAGGTGIADWNKNADTLLMSTESYLEKPEISLSLYNVRTQKKKTLVGSDAKSPIWIW